jgi:hypothetical protein
MTTRSASANATAEGSSNSNSQCQCRSFDCVFDDETAKHFAQDDKCFYARMHDESFARWK